MRRQPLGQSPERAVEVAGMLKALGHPVRLRIVALLCEGERNVSELAELLAVGQAIVSQQLRILRMSRLVEVRRENGFATYSLGEPNLVQMVSCMECCSLH